MRKSQNSWAQSEWRWETSNLFKAPLPYFSVFYSSDSCEPNSHRLYILGPAPVFLKLKSGITTHSQLERWLQTSHLHGCILLLRSLFLFWLQILWLAWFISSLEGLVSSLSAVLTFVHSSWWILSTSNRLTFESCNLEKLYWFISFLPSVFLCSPSLELFYVEFLAAKIESLIFISLQFCISTTSYSLCS